MIELSVANNFTKTPGFRYRTQSPTTSGQQFREEHLEPAYLEALHSQQKLRVILDGTDGYLTSFLEEAFGGLQRNHLTKNILETVEIISNDEKHWIDDIKRYVAKALKEIR